MSGPPGASDVETLAASPTVQAFLSIRNTGVYIVESDGRIVWASPSMKEVTGWGPQELVGRNGWNIFVRPDDLPEVARFRAMLSEADGTIWMRLHTGPTPDTWFKVDTMLRGRFIVCAFRREPNPANQNLHWFLAPRR